MTEVTGISVTGSIFPNLEVRKFDFHKPADIKLTEHPKGKDQREWGRLLPRVFHEPVMKALPGWGEMMKKIQPDDHPALNKPTSEAKAPTPSRNISRVETEKPWIALTFNSMLTASYFEWASGKWIEIGERFRLANGSGKTSSSVMETSQKTGIFSSCFPLDKCAG